MSNTLSLPVHWLATLLSAVLAGLFFVLLTHGLRKLRGGDHWSAAGWTTATALTSGCGLWTAWYCGLAGLQTPWDAAFRPQTTGWAWGAAVLGMLALLGLSRLMRATPARHLLQALVLALSWAGVCLLGRYSLGVRPLGGVLALPWLATAMVALAAFGGLGLAFDERARGLGRFTLRQSVAAALFGLVAGMAQDLALTGLLFGDDSPVLADATLDTMTLRAAIGVGAILLLLGLLVMLLDARARGQQARLASSLSDAERRLREQSLADPLTRLPNRLLFEEKLDDALAHAEDRPGELAVLFIDLDGFKPINDSFGHVAGDAVLADVGRRLGALTRTVDLAARVGGDEFLLLMKHPGTKSAAAHMAQQVLKSISEPYTLPNGVLVNLSCSVGIVMYAEHGPGHKLIANADAAMYAAKRAGGSTYAFFEPSMEQDARMMLEVQRDLRIAIERQQLELYYQPKVHALSGQITGVEALVRWHHPERGLVMPTVFIPVAERFGLISALGHWVIEDACRQIREWMDQGLRMRVAVNLSMHQLRQDDLVPKVRAALSRYRVDPALLTFEITESVAMEDNTVRAFSALAGVGVSLSIDDFGTAYSNFAALRKLPAKQLKIDRSLFTDIHDSPDALAVVDAMIRMAHALGLKVVAEGVETEIQRDLLLDLRCDEFQGYLYAKPMSAKLLTLWATDEGETHPVGFRASIYDDGAAMLG